MKKITLNGHVRAEIIRRIMHAWRAQQAPAPDMSGRLPTADEIKTVEARRKREAEYRHQLSLALGAFRTVGELVDEWPGMSRFVPAYITDPVGAIILPELPDD